MTDNININVIDKNIGVNMDNYSIVDNNINLTDILLQSIETNNNSIANTNATNTIDNINNINDAYISSNIEYKYICIKKQFFNVNMIYLNYDNIKKKQYIEIIYKSPSIFLDGIFLKTPPLTTTQIQILNTYNKYSKNNIIKIRLNNTEHYEFINIMKAIDDYI